MLDAVWRFLGDPTNRSVIGWAAGGVAACVTGVWAVVKFFARDRRPADLPAKTHPSASADHGSVAVGGENRNSPISIGQRSPGKRGSP